MFKNSTYAFLNSLRKIQELGEAITVRSQKTKELRSQVLIIY